MTLTCDLPPSWVRFVNGSPAWALREYPRPPKPWTPSDRDGADVNRHLLDLKPWGREGQTPSKARCS